MANEIHGALSYLNLYTEATWGTKPGSPDYVALPVDDYSVKFVPEARQQRPYIGSFYQKHSRRFKGMVTGGFTCPLFGWHIDPDGGGIDTSLAEYLFNWALDNAASGFMTSKGAEWAQGPDTDNLGHSGLRVNSMSVEGDAESGMIIASVDLMGKLESDFTTAQTLPTDWEKLVDFEFADAVLTIGGTDTAISQFSWSVANNLAAKYRGGRSPDLLPRGGARAILFSFTLDANGSTYTDAKNLLTADTEYDIQLTLKGLHNGSGASGTATQIVLDMPRCSLLDPDDQRGAEDLLQTNVQTVALKPDTSEAECIITPSLITL